MTAPIRELSHASISFSKDTIDDGVHPSMGISNTRGSIINSKLSRVLSSSYADPDLRSALGIISQRHILNNYENRRKLQVDAPTSLLESDTYILRHFKTMAEDLRTLGIEIRSMSSLCNDMRSNIDTGKSRMCSLVEESRAIITKKQILEQKLCLLEGFLSKFNITDRELSDISSTTTNSLNENFFVVIHKLKRIHTDCQILLATENTRAGLDVMEQMTKTIHAAFQQLQLWVQSEFRMISFDNPSLSTQVKHALKVLAEQPVSLQNCLDILSESRQKILHQNFISALTSINKGAGLLPIEMTAHDPLRYASDMLAWVHSTMVGELEVLSVLFSKEEDKMDRESTLAPLASGMEASQNHFNEKETVKSLTDRGMRTIIKPLQSRIEQVVITNHDPVIAYKLANLLGFYRDTFRGLVGENAEMHRAMADLFETCHKAFHTSLQERAHTRIQELPQISDTLDPPPFLVDAIQDLRILLSSLRTSFAPVNDLEGEINLILNEALQPYLDSCKLLSSNLKKFDAEMFQINCFSAAQGALDSSILPSPKTQSFTETMTSYISILITWQEDSFLERSGLKQLYSVIRLHEDNVSKELLEQELQAFAVALDQFLPMASIEARFQLRFLTSPQIKTSIIDAAAQKFIDEFGHARLEILNILPEEIVNSILPITAQEIETLIA